MDPVTQGLAVDLLIFAAAPRSMPSLTAASEKAAGSG